MIFYCQVCGHEIVEDVIGRDSVCPNCNAYLHACIQCEFYDPSAHNQCREPSAEFVSDREGANFCEFFRPNSRKKGESKKIDPDQLLKQLLGSNDDK